MFCHERNKKALPVEKKKKEEKGSSKFETLEFYKQGKNGR